MLTVQWLLIGAAVLVALGAFLRARRAARRLERLTESYWELRYEHGQLRARVARLEADRSARAGAPSRSAAAGTPDRHVRPAVLAEAIMNHVQRIRRRRDRRRHRRLRRRHPRRAARPEGRRRREAEGARRHLPALGLHSDQGAARARARAEDRPAREGVGRHDRRRRTARHRHERRCRRARTGSSPA